MSFQITIIVFNKTVRTFEWPLEKKKKNYNGVGNT